MLSVCSLVSAALKWPEKAIALAAHLMQNWTNVPINQLRHKHMGKWFRWNKNTNKAHSIPEYCVLKLARPNHKNVY